jgi:isoleucyl-tRNA synthetase
MAPFTPFLAEELFLKLTGGELGESVHLLDWPKPGEVNEDGLRKMSFIREMINEGLSERAAAKIKVRQPLKHVLITAETDLAQSLEEAYQEIIKEELNVKAVMLGKGNTKRVTLDKNISSELKAEGQIREVIRYVQSARKKAGLNVDDRIRLTLFTDSQELAQAIDAHTDTIAAETLATGLKTAQEGDFAHNETAKVEGEELRISLQKAD